MNDLISRESTIKAIEDVFCTNCNSYNGVMCRACEHMDDMDIIEDMPAADVQPVAHGHWTPENERPKSVMYCCSVCGKISHDRPLGSARVNIKTKCTLRYCPHCGAKMDGDAENA